MVATDVSDLSARWRSECSSTRTRRCRSSCDRLSCRASSSTTGYPFPQVEAEWDAAADTFRFLPGAELPRFPIEGIFTRNINAGDAPEGFPVAFLETSSPGLKGQSGGPIVDVHGVVWAIQVKTVSYPLGFSPVVNTPDGKAVAQEHQFLNAGIGSHPVTLEAIFAKHNIAVNWVD